MKVRLDWFVRSFDFYSQFINGEDEAFPDFPSQVFSPGTGTVVTGWNGEEELVYQIETIYLGPDEDG